jgi:hypothetical protein
MTDSGERRKLFKAGWSDMGKVFTMAFVLDSIYQLIELRAFYPLQALTVSIILAVLPYVSLRGPATRLVRLFKKRTY